MDLEVAIRLLILGNAAVAARVGDRVRPFYGAQLDARPFVTILTTGATGTLTHGGRAGATNSTVEIGIVADGYDDVVAIAGSAAAGDGVRGTLDGLVASVPAAGATLVPCVFDDESDVEQTPVPGSNVPVFLKTLTFRVRSKPAAG